MAWLRASRLVEWLGVAAPVAAAFVPIVLTATPEASAAPPWDPIEAHTPYDPDIRKYHKWYWGGTGVDWRLLRNQLFYESSFREDAVSTANAQGLAQFLVPTWKGLQAEIPALQGKSPFDSRAALQAQSYYMAQLRSSWTAHRSERDRMLLTCASYNAGLGNLLKAQRACQRTDRTECNSWDAIVKHLPTVTGSHAPITQHYAESIVLAVPPHETGQADSNEDQPLAATVPADFARSLDGLARPDLDVILFLVRRLQPERTLP